MRKIQNNIVLNTEYKNNIKYIIEAFINLYKSSNKNEKDFKNFEKENQKQNIYNQRERHNYFLKMTNKIIKEYQKELKRNNQIDYHDMINIAIKIVKRKKIHQYKYIFIDEYQDISLNKILLIKEIQKQTNAKLVAVGDDFQSIYSFTGSNIEVIKNFKKYFDKAKIKKLRNTYRNSLELLKITQNFICKNPYQIKKKLKSKIRNDYPITIYYYLKDEEKVWKKILSDAKAEKLLVLGRNNNDEASIPHNNKIKYLTIHKSKGLETETTIIINLENKYNSLPNKIKDSEYLTYVKTKEEKFKYAEERRLFYVALTRCKKNNILIVKKDNPSIFVKELLKDSKNNIKIIDTTLEK